MPSSEAVSDTGPLVFLGKLPGGFTLLQFTLLQRLLSLAG
jgi:hypothetical protein